MDPPVEGEPSQCRGDLPGGDGETKVPEPLRDLGGRHRSGQGVSLAVGGPEDRGRLDHRPVLKPFHDDIAFEVLPHAHDGSDHADRVEGRGPDPLQEPLVDLDAVEGKCDQSLQGAEAGAQIIHGELDSDGHEAINGLIHGFGIDLPVFQKFKGKA